MKSQMYISRGRQGPWYVRYPEGYETGLMNREEADSLAQIFGGEVHRWAGAEIEEPQPSRLGPWQVLTMAFVVAFLLWLMIVK